MGGNDSGYLHKIALEVQLVIEMEVSHLRRHTVIAPFRFGLITFDQSRSSALGTSKRISISIDGILKSDFQIK